MAWGTGTGEAKLLGGALSLLSETKPGPGRSGGGGLCPTRLVVERWGGGPGLGAGALWGGSFQCTGWAVAGGAGFWGPEQAGWTRG